MQKCANLVELDKCYKPNISEHLLAKIGFDTAENALSRMWQKCVNFGNIIAPLGRRRYILWKARFYPYSLAPERRFSALANFRRLW